MMLLLPSHHQPIVSSNSNNCLKDVACSFVSFHFIIIIITTLCFCDYYLLLHESTVCPFLLICRDNGITSPSARGQHCLLPGFAEEAERSRQRRKCLLLPLQHLLSPGYGDAGGQRQHGRADVRGNTTLN